MGNLTSPSSDLPLQLDSDKIVTPDGGGLGQQTDKIGADVGLDVLDDKSGVVTEEKVLLILNCYIWRNM